MQEMASQYQVQQQSDHLKETSDFEMARLHSKATAGYCALTTTATAMVENDAAQNRSFDSVRTDSGCGSSIAAYNNNSSNSSSGSSSNGSNGLLLPSTSSAQSSADVIHNRRCPNNILADNTSPSGCTSSSSSASIFGGHASNSAADNASSTTLAETASSASTVKSSTFDLPPSHSVMDRMWRKEVGSSSHLLAPSVENSRESLLPYHNGMWTSPMHCKQYNGQQQEEEGMLLVRHNYEDVSGDFTLPRNSALVSHHQHHPKGGVGVLSDFPYPPPTADTSDQRHLLVHHYHLQQASPSSLPSNSASASSSPLRQHGFSPTDHLRAGMRKNKASPLFLPSAPLSSSNPRHQKSPSPLLIGDSARGGLQQQQQQQHPSQLLNGQQQPQASKVASHQLPRRSSLLESAAAATTATVNLLAQELETRKGLLEALVKDKNDTAV